MNYSQTLKNLGDATPPDELSSASDEKSFTDLSEKPNQSDYYIPISPDLTKLKENRLNSPSTYTNKPVTSSSKLHLNLSDINQTTYLNQSQRSLLGMHSPALASLSARSTPSNSLFYLHKELNAANSRLTSLYQDLQSSTQKLNFLQSEVVRLKRSNYIEISERLSSLNSLKISAEVSENNNERLERENKMIREVYKDLLRKIENNKERVVERKDERNKEKEFKREKEIMKVEGNNNRKEKIELELRKMGISSQRRRILKEELAEINERKRL